MKAQIISALVQTLLLLLDGPTVKRALDALLDIAEEAAVRSDNQIDDLIVLPLCAKVREELQIPEFDT